MGRPANLGRDGRGNREDRAYDERSRRRPVRKTQGCWGEMGMQHLIFTSSTGVILFRDMTEA